MPEIPEGKYRPCIEETMIDLLESIALEEIAISHVLNAEGEKLQAILGKYQCAQIDFCEMTLATKGVSRMVEDLIMKEWLLLTKLRYVGDFIQSNDIYFCCKGSGGQGECGCKDKEEIVPHPTSGYEVFHESTPQHTACPVHGNGCYPWPQPCYDSSCYCSPKPCPPCERGCKGCPMTPRG